jgi:hypothetical protein
MYYLEDHSLMINEPKEVNSGTPQGVFLKRQMVLKQDGSNTPLLPTDFCVGLDVGILGRSIRIFDADQYTREFFNVRIINYSNFITVLFRTLDNPNQMPSNYQLTASLKLKSKFQLRKTLR